MRVYRRGCPVTPRELLILSRAAQGCTNPQIARELGVSANTIATYLRNARLKLDARDRAHLVYRAIQTGLLRVEECRANQCPDCHGWHLAPEPLRGAA